MPRGRKPGYHHSEETKQTMRLKKLGVPKSEEHRQHMSEAKRGKKLIIGEDGKRHWILPEKNLL